jgi:hypothetical protein
MVPSATRAHAVRRWTLAIAIAGLLLEPPAGGQEVDESQFKAAFMFNVAKFVEWPATSFASPSDPIVICILGATPVDAALAQAPSSPLIDGRKLLIRRIKDARDGTDCHILFVSASEQKRWRWTSDVKTGGVLTVGESYGFASDGGVVDFKVESTKVRIEVNLEAAQRAGLRLSSKLLSLTTIVRR